ncbi:MAG: hypothetical protein WAX12_07960 [Candidatus Microthrix subdominans]
MSVTEESRYHLHQQLDAAVGMEGAVTMMELLPPVGWADVATKRDLDQQSDRLELLIRAEFAGVATEVSRVRADFEGAPRRMRTAMLSALFSVAGILIALSIFGPH